MKGWDVGEEPSPQSTVTEASVGKGAPVPSVKVTVGTEMREGFVGELITKEREKKVKEEQMWENELRDDKQNPLE